MASLQKMIETVLNKGDALPDKLAQKMGLDIGLEAASTGNALSLQVLLRDESDTAKWVGLFAASEVSSSIVDIKQDILELKNHQNLEVSRMANICEEIAVGAGFW